VIDQAFSHLAQGPAGEVVLGPDLDGGFYLVGLNAGSSGLFPSTMSTETVFQQTVHNAQTAGRSVSLLEPFLDIDSGDDLRLFWLEFGGRADVREWSTWRRLNGTAIMELLE
jgi:hypothetical protein